jgi:RHS repeat-associated protein
MVNKEKHISWCEQSLLLDANIFVKNLAITTGSYCYNTVIECVYNFTRNFQQIILNGKKTIKITYLYYYYNLPIAIEIGSRSFITVRQAHFDRLNLSHCTADLSGEAVQHLQYLPFWESFVSQTSSSWQTRHTFSGKEKDVETGYSYFGARYYDGDLSIFLSVDRFTDKYPSLTPYEYAANNPVNLIDINGDSVRLISTILPDSDPNNNATSQATHTFLYIKHDDGSESYYAFGPKGDNFFGEDQLTRQSYDQDLAVIMGDKPEDLKEKILIDVPKGMTSKEFDESVSRNALRFGGNEDIKYDALTSSPTTGNCNSSTYTILLKAGVNQKDLRNIKNKISGFSWGFGILKPWTANEQQKAIDAKKEITSNWFLKIFQSWNR